MTSKNVWSSRVRKVQRPSPTRRGFADPRRAIRELESQLVSIGDLQKMFDEMNTHVNVIRPACGYALMLRAGRSGD